MCWSPSAPKVIPLDLLAISHSMFPAMACLTSHRQLVIVNKYLDWHNPPFSLKIYACNPPITYYKVDAKARIFGSFIRHVNTYDFPYVSTMARAWSWYSKSNLLNATHVGNARLLGLSGLKPGTQLCSMHVPHFDLKGDNIKALWIASESSPLRKINPLPTFMQNSTSLPPSSWLRFANHLTKSWGAGLGPKNFAIKSCSLRRAIRAFNFSVSTLNVIASFLTKKPLKFLSILPGSMSPACSLYGLSWSYGICLLASAKTSITASDNTTSPFGPSSATHLPRSSIIGSNLGSPPYRTFAAKVSILVFLDPGHSLRFVSLLRRVLIRFSMDLIKHRVAQTHHTHSPLDLYPDTPNQDQSKKLLPLA